MVAECTHILTSGHKCRRIAPSGKRFCLAHVSKKRRDLDTLDRQMQDFADSLHKLTLPQLLETLQHTLNDLEVRIAASNRPAAIRAGIAVTTTLDVLYQLEAHQFNTQRS
jgi:hypothetical protein